MSKIFIYIIIFSSFIFVIFGVPVIHQEYNSIDAFATSRRCARVGDLQGLISCLGNARISGVKYIEQVIQELNDISPGMGKLFILVFIFHITLVPVVVRRLTYEDS